MIKKTLFLSLLLVSLADISLASSFRCEKGVVSEGDSRYDVLRRCRQPFLSDSTEKEVIRKANPSEWTKVEVKTETWLYNLGPSNLMRLMIFENEKLVEIKSLGYGYRDGDIGKFCGDTSKLSKGMTSVEVLMHWGRPSYRSDRREERILKTDANTFVKTVVNISEWIYDLGPNRITKNLIFENGELMEIKGDKYGM